jgi:hypothetical protein
MFCGTALHRAEKREYPWRQTLTAVLAVLGLVLGAALWHISPKAWNFVAIRPGFDALGGAGLTFAVAMACDTGRSRACWPGSAWSATRSTCCTRC